MSDAMRLPTLAEVDAHFRRLEKLAHGNGVALVRKAKVEAVRRLLDNELGEKRVRELRERLRRA